MTPGADRLMPALGDLVDVATTTGDTISGTVLGGQSGATIWLHIKVNRRRVLCIPWHLVSRIAVQ